MAKLKTIVQSSKLIATGYIFTIILLFFYSFTQVDLGLTLTRHPVFLPYQKFFQYIGYFNRPLSTYLFVAIFFFLLVFYFLILRFTYQKKVMSSLFWKIILLTSAILLFSYNAFSYDLFNYIFDAKIITYYGQNPYQHKALDYPQDPMLSFMHWTHRLYPYGPIWLLITVPFSYIGLQFFLPTFLLFKLLIIGSFIGTVHYIEKISQKLFPSDSMFNTIFFALNPLVIIESLVSAHNDIVMMFFAMMATYLLIEKKYALSFLVLLLSVGIKFSTLFLVPIFLYVLILNYKKKSVDWERIFVVESIVMIIAVIFSSARTELQPWYFLWVVPFAAFISRKKLLFIPTSIFSFILLAYYVPFLYSGNWDPPIPSIKNWLLIFGMLFSGYLIIFPRTKKEKV